MKATQDEAFAVREITRVSKELGPFIERQFSRMTSRGIHPRNVMFTLAHVWAMNLSIAAEYQITGNQPEGVPERFNEVMDLLEKWGVVTGDK